MRVAAPLERRLGRRGRVAAIALEVGVEPPHPCPNPLDGLALPVVEADQLVDEPLGVDPAQRVSADVELTGVITDDNGLTEVSMIDHAAPQRPFGGDLHRIGVDL